MERLLRDSRLLLVRVVLHGLFQQGLPVFVLLVFLGAEAEQARLTPFTAGPLEEQVVWLG